MRDYCLRLRRILRSLIRRSGAVTFPVAVAPPNRSDIGFTKCVNTGYRNEMSLSPYGRTRRYTSPGWGPTSTSAFNGGEGALGMKGSLVVTDGALPFHWISQQILESLEPSK